MLKEQIRMDIKNLMEATKIMKCKMLEQLAIQFPLIQTIRSTDLNFQGLNLLS